MNRKKLLLVFPKSPISSYADLRFSEIMAQMPGGFMNVALPTVAALTPREFEVRIIDENVEPIDFHTPYDLVGITGFVTQFFRAQELAEEFRKRGTLVVCGGPSVSLSPERWRPFADVLIIGEAERIWPQFLRDYLNDSYKNEYRESERFDLTHSPIPDYSGFSPSSRKKYMLGLVQASRGCPHSCEFCSVGAYMGRKMRYKPVDTVVQEVEELKKLGIGLVLIADDNLSAERSQAKAILTALRDWNRGQRRPTLFITQLSIDVATDDEFLELAAEAGMTAVQIGIESPCVESLKETGKHQNVGTDLLQDIKKFQEYGITVISTCIVGFDHDGLSIFKDQLDFHMQSAVPNTQIYPLQALDGTALKRRIVRENRYLDWEPQYRSKPEQLYNLSSFTMIPKQMSLQQLQAGTFWLLWKLYDPEAFLLRLKGFFTNYETSTRRQNLRIPRYRLDRKRWGIVLRLLKFLARASRTDRRSFWATVKIGLRSSHPQRFGVAAMAYITLVNTRKFLLSRVPGIAEIPYPS
ncbi:MAG: radical SAM protein [Spirochaetaceae bacterium]|nr:MAG: radical SAM protein [Spirochaetaceae bacterium]